MLALLFPLATTAQTVATYEPEVARGIEFPLTIRNIMRGPELVGEAPVGVTWSDDSNWIYFRWRPGGGAWHDSRSLYRVPAEGGEPERIPDEVADTLGPRLSGGDISPDGRLRVTASGGDLYLVDRRSGEITRLTETTDGESSPRFSADGRRIFYRQGDNLYAMPVRGGGPIEQLTDIRSGPPPGARPEAAGQRGLLEAQQAELFEHIRIRKEREEEQRVARERAEERRPVAPTYIAKDERVQQLDVDPTGRWVALQVAKPAPGSKNTIVPAWVTESGYTEDLNARPKVGDRQGETRFALIDTEAGETTWLDVWPAAEDAPGEGGEEGAGAPRDASDHPVLASGALRGWNDAGTHALLTAISFDYKEWRLYALEAATGSLTLLDSLQDSAWVGGPCFSFVGPCTGWIPDSDRAWYVSEATGWAHLYTVRADGGDRRALTEGAWEVRGVSIPEGADYFVLHTSEASPYDTQAYRMDFDGSDRRRLTDAPGLHQVTVSPDGERFADVFSRSNRPPELFVARNRPGAELEQVTVSPTAEWLTFPWKEAEIVEVPARDGTLVPARIYRPADVGARPNGAGVVFVHGAGYLQNVHHGWSGYYREFMFHHFLAAQGYTVLDLDYRGSAGHGRDWRTATYRWMGGKDLSDNVDGAEWLVEHEGVDPERLGIYGGSYGGFITLMALFTEPGRFKAGAALRSVTDWAHYNHWYTSRILNQPQDDEEAYRRSSPIYFAEGLQDHLLILHGMVDTNVHFSDVVRLAQRLIELGKETWEMAVYPVENHGFVEPASWTDEYRRIYELFDRWIGGGALVRPDR